MSLRARLVLALVLVAAAGLVTLGAVTYAAQRSFLLDRIDAQTEAAAPALVRKLAEAGIALPGDDRRGGPGDPFDGRRGGGRGPDDTADLPSGTFGQLRSLDGAPVGATAVLSFAGERIPSPPALPSELPIGEVVTVEARDGDVEYRVRAETVFRERGVVVVAVPLTGVDATLSRLLLVEGLVIAAVLALLSGLAWVLVRVGLRPLERIGQTADAIAAGDLSRRVEVAGERTEVGRLGTALNAMLGRLEGAFAEREASERRLRQFLSDASHELRTPLASIRGYAELHRMGAMADDAEVGRSMGRIEEESARMGVLVEDLLALARLEEVREVPVEVVDLGDLAADAVADARATDPARPIDAELPDEALVRGSPDQLRQVLANLVRNALVHTPPGTPVEVAVRRGAADGWVELEVRDHGPGLPTSDHAALFDRFWRAEGGRERGRAGAGLGLAIVAGVVAQHGGTVAAADAQGGGACFTVRLPPA